MNTPLLMTLHVRVATPFNVGAVTHGTRGTTPLARGTFEAPRLGGTVLPETGGDGLLLRSGGVLEMDFRANRLRAVGAGEVGPEGPGHRIIEIL